MKINNNYRKLAIVIVGILIIVTISIVIYIKALKPKPITEIKRNIVYISGYYKEYPNDDDPRFYIEFKDDGTYILMYDDSRRSQDSYWEDGSLGVPVIECYFGKYKRKNGNYLISPTRGCIAEFKDAASVDKNLINFYKEKNYEKDFRAVGNIVCKLKNGQYMLGAPTEDKKSYRKDVYYYLLYNKSDIKKLPSNPEEFRKQFKMDKKAEQERLAEQKRLAEQSH
ncbi:MAG: hypothetical protein HG465_003440 [Mogibacterium sp.]|jgi:hypothetical protein|uniref:hypothetical protein n=1 Tax=Mogibacterium sp. TaxID=2049035 RepID=UPI0017F4103F|nr:hypothetical protein [Mogibacterium sp.]MBB1533161.1 hypothetical protein [Mogibacterium sp.]